MWVGGMQTDSGRTSPLRTADWVCHEHGSLCNDEHECEHRERQRHANRASHTPATAKTPAQSRFPNGRIPISELLCSPRSNVYDEHEPRLQGQMRVRVAPRCNAVAERRLPDQSVQGDVSGHSRGKSSDSALKGAPRRRWTQEEDELLTSLVAEHGPSRWERMSHHFPDRGGRHLRLRWMNHLSMNTAQVSFTPEEDALILRAQQQWGNQWRRISRELNGRSDNAVKNRFHTLMRRRSGGPSSRPQHYD